MAVTELHKLHTQVYRYGIMHAQVTSSPHPFLPHHVAGYQRV